MPHERHMNDLMNRNWPRAHFVIVQLRLDYNLLVGNLSLR